MNTKKKVGNTILVVILTILSLLWIYPVFMILINSLKKESAISTGSVFKLPTAETFAGLENYINAIESKGFLNSLYYDYFRGSDSAFLFHVCMVHYPCKGHPF